MKKVISKTESLCPHCFKKIPAEKILEDNRVYMEKCCTEHGKFKTIIWSGSTSIESWIRNKERILIVL